jgi:hypothetical protein
VQLQQDMDTLYRQMQLNHPDLFAHWPKDKADKAFQKAKGSINRPMNRIEFTRALSPWVSGFRDGHTFVDVNFESEEMNLYDSLGGTFFPLEVKIIEGRLFCSQDAAEGSAIKKGDEILQINNVSALQLVSEMKSFWSADGEANALATLQRLFGFSLWVRYGWGEKCSVQFRHDGKEGREVLTDIRRRELVKRLFGPAGMRKLHLYPEQSLAVVEINSYSSTTKALAFIDSCFGIIKKEGIGHVALDLRRNGGGNSYIGDYFLAYLNRKPYNTISSKRWKIGPMLEALPPTHMARQALDRDRKTYKQEGAFLQSAKFSPQPPTQVKDTSLYSNVQFYLLTSPRTYSSAHMTALAVKCGGLGTIIGQPTGERLNLTGEINEYKLPNSGLVVVIPTASYETACGDGEQVGVQPDVLVPQRADDLRTGRDPELEVVKELIRKGK